MVRFPKPTPAFGEYGTYGINMEAHQQRGRSNSYWNIPAFTIDSLKISSPISAIKIDAQGADFNVLRGAQNTIARNQCAVLFEHEGFGSCGVRMADYVNFFNDINYVHKQRHGTDYLFAPKGGW